MAHAKRNSALSVLEKIQPRQATTRFLQFWDPHTRRLSFGYGDGQHGVLIRSDQSLDVAESGFVRSRLARPVVDRWLEGPAKIDGGQLFEQTGALLQSYAYFHDSSVPKLVALWTMGTYLYSVFGYYGYLFLHSSRKRSGKTRVLELISHLAFEATTPQNAPSVAAIRDMASEGRTLQLDTLERWKGKSPEAHSAAMELLDAGFRRGGTIPKMVSFQDGWRRMDFPVYAPYSLAAISKTSLSDTAIDRSFSIEMWRKSRKIRTRPYHFHQVEKQCEPLQTRLYLWALSNAPRVAAMYESQDLQARLDRLGLNDRAADIWKPILAIAQVIGIDTVDLGLLAQEMGRDPDAAEDDRDLTILLDLLAHAKGQNVIGSTTTLQEWVSGNVTIHTLQTLLAKWGFEQRNRWIDGQSRRVWVLLVTKLSALAHELTESGATSIPLQKSDQSDQTSKGGGFSLRTRDAYDDPSELVDSECAS